MPTRRRTGIETSHVAASAGAETLNQLFEDPKRAKTAYREFHKLDVDQDRQACEAMALQVPAEVTVHAVLFQGRRYLAARAAIAEKGRVDEAKIEDGWVPALIEQLSGMSPDGQHNFASPRPGNAGRRNVPASPGINAVRSD